jgi:acetyl esterase/lipase
MNIFEAVGDDRPNRPVLLLMTGTPLSSRGWVSALDGVAETLARYGMVVAVAQRRSGPTSCDGCSFGMLIRVVQDQKAAVRYLRAEAATLRLDGDRILSGGFSSGGIVALIANYYTDEDAAPDLRVLLDSLGGWEGEQGTPGVSSAVAGNVVLAGMAYDLKDRPEFVEADEPPVFFVHGSFDVEHPCGRSVIDGSDPPVYRYGACALHERAQEVGLFSHLFLVAGDHDRPPEAVADWVSALMWWTRTVLEGGPG